MSLILQDKKKKKKGKKKKHESASPPDSESSEEELDLMKECHPIAHYMDDRAEMVAQMFSVIKGSKLKAMLPPILKDYDVEKLKLKCLDQILGMSEKRIMSIIEGEILDQSSESDVPSDGTDESESDQSSDSSEKDWSTPTQTSRKRKQMATDDEPADPDSSKVLKPEPGTKPEHQGKTLLEILELEMRARAIRALLKQSETDVRSSQTIAQSRNIDNPATVVTETVDLTEPEFPIIVKKEQVSLEEKMFEDKVEKSNQRKKQSETEQEMRNRLIKKKSYRTREQRLENMEPDVPPEPEARAQAEPEVIAIDVVKKEPTEIVIDDPEDGELSSEDEVPPPVVKAEVTDAVATEIGVTHVEGERIAAIDDGEIIADQNVEWQPCGPAEDTLKTTLKEPVVLLDAAETFAPVISLDDSVVESEVIIPPRVDQTKPLESASMDIDDKSVNQVCSSNQLESRTVESVDIATKACLQEALALESTELVNVFQPNQLEPRAEEGMESEPVEEVGVVYTANEMLITSYVEESNAGETVAITDRSKTDGQVLSEIPIQTHFFQQPLNIEMVEAVAAEATEANYKSQETVDSLEKPSGDILQMQIAVAPEKAETVCEVAEATGTSLKPESCLNVSAGSTHVVDLADDFSEEVTGLTLNPMLIDLEDDADLPPPCYELDDSDDEVIYIDDYDIGENSQDDSSKMAGDLEPVNWRGRWLRKSKIQELVKSNKICALVRKRLKTKKALMRVQSFEEPAATAAPVAAATPEPEPVADPAGSATPPPPVFIEGSVSEYERLFGKKVINIEEIVVEVLQNMVTAVEGSSRGELPGKDSTMEQSTMEESAGVHPKT